MENQHPHIKGYRDLSAEEIAALNRIKEKAEEVPHTIASLNLLRPDPRWVAIATTHLQQGFMALAAPSPNPPRSRSERLQAAGDVLSRLGFTAYTLRLNHRGVLAGMLEAGGVPAALHDEALVALDKLDNIGADGVAAELDARGVPRSGATRLLEFFGAVASGAARAEVDPAAFNLDVLGRLDHLLAGGRADSLEELRQVVGLVGGTRTGSHLRLDPSLARGLSYYTGSIFEIAVPDLAGSLGGGGRYDNLIGMFLGESVPACGISLGLERILVVMGERQMFPAGLDARAADVMVTIWNLDTLPDALRLAAELRSGGLRVEVYPDADKIGKQYKYAASRAVPFVTVVGDEEAAQRLVTVKNLTSGEQQRVPRAERLVHAAASIQQDGALRTLARSDSRCRSTVRTSARPTPERAASRLFHQRATVCRSE